ncbi:MAG: hypothetical protein ACM3NQ_05035 [Bacteroidales bacterium]
MALHLVVTDSGVGGLYACAAVERALRYAHQGDQPRITYVNVWPSESGGYNDMADIRAEAEVFDRALAAMTALGPDLIVIACNTLSIVFNYTDYHLRSHTPRADTEVGPYAQAPSAFGLPPVLGIVDAGVGLFSQALAAKPHSRIALFGTKTTIESRVHRDRLIARGVAPDRILSVGCHGLAKSIEIEMEGPSTMQLVDECTARAAQAHATGVGRGFTSGSRDEAATLYLGVCCTHYSYVRDEMRAALQRHAGGVVEVLDPTDRLVSEVAPGGSESEERRSSTAEERKSPGAPTVRVISKVRMPEEKRRVIAGRLAAVSEATAQAVLDYTHVPDLF